MTLSDLTVDRDSDIPLGTQLAWRLRTLVATGRLAPGERLPGVRELAESAGVNVNTARAVYARLEEQGLLASEHGRGTFVAARAAEQADLARVVDEAAAAARKAGLDPRDLAAALYSGAALPPKAGERADAPRTASGQGPPRRSAPGEAASRRAAGGAASRRGARGGDAGVRRELRAEIADLERELVHLDRGAELPESPRPGAGRILTATELRAVRDDLAQRLDQVRDERAEERRRAYAERADALSPSPPQRTWRHAGVWTGKARPGVVWSR
jgi:DNA-binding transcriptional regulator YhcF (GntR family)